VGAEPPTCFRDSEHTGPCQTRGRGAEPPGAQRQPNLPDTPARCALLLDVSQLNLQYQPARYVLLINPVPNLPNNPARYVLLLKVSQPNLQYKPTGHVLLLSVQPAKSCTSSHRLCAPLMCSSYVLLPKLSILVKIAMKITDVRVSHLPGTRYPWVFLHIETDAGIRGLGQVSSGPHSTVVAAAASRLGPLLIGEDPSRIEYIWHKLFASFNSLGSHGFVSALISGVDIALWDIRGKTLDLPIYDLLGGKFHDRLTLYSNGWFTGCSTPDDFARAAIATVGVGHSALKLDPFRGGHTYLSRYAAGYPPAEDLEAVEIVARIREAVGPGVEIYIDAHGRFDVATAIRLANRLAPYRIGWFEEPVPPENWDALRQFRDRSDVPVCVGERLYTRWQFRPVLEQKLAEYIMPDIIRTGGISEMKKIATMAEAYYVPISPHDATGPVTLIAGAQTMMTAPNFFRLEIAYSELERYQQIVDPPFDVSHGFFNVSERPGLGHELRTDYLEQAIAY
jgi:galactonate dehydratase